MNAFGKAMVMRHPVDRQVFYTDDSKTRVRNVGVSVRSGYSPYGIQIFFTCVAARRNSSPSPCTVSSQLRLCP